MLDNVWISQRKVTCKSPLGVNGSWLQDYHALYPAVGHAHKSSFGWICIQIIGTYGSYNQIKGGGWACTHIVANVVDHVITLWGHDDQASQ